MNWIHAVILVVAGLGRYGHSQNLHATFHMDGVKGEATLTWESNTLSVALDLGDFSGTTTVEIHPIWVDYDGMEKCSTGLIGDTLEGKTKDFDFIGSRVNTVTFSDVPSLMTVEGHSLVLRQDSSNTLACGTIQQSGSHVTAVAQFRGSVFGQVYLRQSMTSGSSTRIVSDLTTLTDSRMGEWRITNKFSTCDQFMSTVLADIYDPTSSASNGCSNANQMSCAIGDLSSKLGQVMFSSSAAGPVGRQAFTDSHLPLSGDTSVDGLLMLIFPTDNTIKPACGKINVYAERAAKATFSNDGVMGTVEFRQRSPLDPTVTTVDLEGLRSLAGGYHVHLWPVPEREASTQGSMCAGERVSGHFNPFMDQVGTPSSDSYPAEGATSYDQYEVGDLSGKYTSLKEKQSLTATYTDYNLQLFGRNSIVGRSLVIHRNDAGNSRWVCVNIEPQYPVVVAEALFLHPVIGRVMFMQEKGRPDSETSVFASLDYISETPDTSDHVWTVGNMALGSDMLDEAETSRCRSAGAVFNPGQLWPGLTDNQYSQECANYPMACKTGDLSGKLGRVSIGNSAATQDQAKKWFATDINLPLDGPRSIVGKPVVIRNVENSGSLACAGIKPVHPIVLVARLNDGAFTGTVRFSQNAGFGSRQTMVDTELSTNLGDGQSLKIYELPATEEEARCSDLGEVYDPLNIGEAQPSLTTDDKYKIGDFSRFAAKKSWSSYNLPLSGVNSIKGRSVAVVTQSAVVSCATIDWDVNGWTRVAAAATFTGEINGTISLYQHVHPSGAMSDTTIITDLMYAAPSQQSMDHNWHTHEKVVSGDAQASTGRCMSTGPHYNPFKAAVKEGAYATMCSRTNQLRCELGDQAKKTKTIDVGLGRKLHTDIFEPLVGKFSVQGRSIVVHGENKAAARMVCADIRPQTSSPVAVTFRTSTTFSRLSEAEKVKRISKAYTDAIRSYPGEVVVVIHNSNQEETNVLVHFVGTRSASLRSRFLDIINDENRRDMLGQFSPVISSAGSTSISIFLVLFALVQNVMMSLMTS